MLKDQVITLDEKVSIEKIPNFSYIIAKNGFFFKKETDILSAIIPTKSLPSLVELGPDVKLTIPKIPEDEVANVVSFFRTMMNKETSSECLCQIFFNTRKNQVFIEVPEQYVSGSSIIYRPVTKSNCINIGTVHSHHKMSAFHSHTDVADEEKIDGLHIVFGNLNLETFSISCCLSCNGFRKIVSPLKYISGIERCQNGYRFSNPDLRSKMHPSKWFETLRSIEETPEELIEITTPTYRLKRRPSYLDIAGLDVDEMRLARDMKIPLSKFIMFYDVEDEEEVSHINREIIETYRGGFYEY